MEEIHLKFFLFPTRIESSWELCICLSKCISQFPCTGLNIGIRRLVVPNASK